MENSYILHLAGWTLVPSVVTTFSALFVIFWAFNTRRTPRPLPSLVQLEVQNIQDGISKNARTSKQVIYTDSFVEQNDTDPDSHVQPNNPTHISPTVSQVYEQFYNTTLDCTHECNQIGSISKSNLPFLNAEVLKEIAKDENDREVENYLETNHVEANSVFGSVFRENTSTGRIEVEYSRQSHHGKIDTENINCNSLCISVSNEINIPEFPSNLDTPGMLEESTVIMNVLTKEAVKSNSVEFGDRVNPRNSMMLAGASSRAVFNAILNEVLFKVISELSGFPIMKGDEGSIYIDKHNNASRSSIAEIVIQDESEIMSKFKEEIIIQTESDKVSQLEQEIVPQDDEKFKITNFNDIEIMSLNRNIEFSTTKGIDKGNILDQDNYPNNFINKNDMHAPTQPVIKTVSKEITGNDKFFIEGTENTSNSNECNINIKADEQLTLKMVTDSENLINIVIPAKLYEQSTVKCNTPSSGLQALVNGDLANITQNKINHITKINMPKCSKDNTNNRCLKVDKKRGGVGCADIDEVVVVHQKETDTEPTHKLYTVLFNKVNKDTHASDLIGNKTPTLKKESRPANDREQEIENLRSKFKQKLDSPLSHCKNKSKTAVEYSQMMIREDKSLKNYVEGKNTPKKEYAINKCIQRNGEEISYKTCKDSKKRTLTIAYLLDQPSSNKSQMTHIDKRPSLENVSQNCSNDIIEDRLKRNEWLETPHLDEDDEAIENEIIYTSDNSISVTGKDNENLEISANINPNQNIIPEIIEDVATHNIKRLMRDLIKPCADLPWNDSNSELGLRYKPVQRSTESTPCTTHYMENTTYNTSTVTFEPTRTSGHKFRKNYHISQKSIKSDASSKAFDPNNPVNNIHLAFGANPKSREDRQLNRIFDVGNPLNNICLNISKRKPVPNTKKPLPHTFTIGQSIILRSDKDISSKGLIKGSIGNKKYNEKDRNDINSDEILNHTSTLDAIDVTSTAKIKTKKMVIVKEKTIETDKRIESNEKIIKKWLKVKSIFKSSKKKTKRVKNQVTAPISFESKSKSNSVVDDTDKMDRLAENKKFNILYTFGNELNHKNSINKTNTSCIMQSLKEKKHLQNFCNYKCPNVTYVYKNEQKLLSVMEQRQVIHSKIVNSKFEHKNNQKEESISNLKNSESRRSTSFVKKSRALKRSGSSVQSEKAIMVNNNKLINGPLKSIYVMKSEMPFNSEKPTEVNELSAVKSEKAPDIKDIDATVQSGKTNVQSEETIKVQSEKVEDLSAVSKEKSIKTDQSMAPNKELYHNGIEDIVVLTGASGENKDLESSINDAKEKQLGLDFKSDVQADAKNPLILEIDSYSFMGTWGCQWEQSTATEWSFLLLHGRIRLRVNFPDSELECLHPDTPVLMIQIENINRGDREVATHAVAACMRSLSALTRAEACARAGDVAALLSRCARVVSAAAHWACTMQHASAHLGYALNRRRLTLQIANVPLRSVWDVTLAITYEPFGPRVSEVCVATICSDVEITQADVDLLLRDVQPGWDSVPRTVWKLYNYLKYMKKEHSSPHGNDAEPSSSIERKAPCQYITH